ncbi:MAG: (deoxy)nucleoside triphosphate pyrophosphohydrolase [Oscillospiraceae bacterium]|nr:(deoxy)nucleoside triphosphate pyrophosphohydrolase [Oscillospiraceae bacterium]
MIHVVGALIRKDNRFMICQRPAHKKRGLLWEFVGGKMEAGETMEEALQRECREELDITLQVGDCFLQVDHQYPDIHILLSIFHGEIAEGTPVLKEHADLKWITVDEIDQYDFCPADGPVLEALKQGYGFR